MYTHTPLNRSSHTPLHRQRPSQYPVPTVTGGATRSRILSAHLLSINQNNFLCQLAEHHQAVAHLSPPLLLKSLATQSVSRFIHLTLHCHVPHPVVNIAIYAQQAHLTN